MKFPCIALVAIGVLVAAPASAQSTGKAPLGLEWGQSQDDTKKLGVELGTGPDDSFGKGAALTKLPQAVADAEIVYGSYGFNDKLFRIVIISKPFANDPFGNGVISRYSALQGILSEKYGKPAQTHRLGDSIYAEQRYFVSGIQSGRTFWYSNYSTPELSIQLGIVADDQSTARWKIIYENKPLNALFEQSKRAKEKGSL
ncbi:hypothetical protein ABIF73_000835 [Bradyrhizobium japonicum]|uniref:hypothetical protein n=1 Tax=Bradyrhizobium japonicum TaxID=375 RepID=UPI0033919104